MAEKRVMEKSENCENKESRKKWEILEEIKNCGRYK